MPITEVAVGTQGTVARLEGSEAVVRRLISLGVLEGRSIELRHRLPVPVVRLGGLDVAMESDIAQAIWVKLEGGPHED